MPTQPRSAIPASVPDFQTLFTCSPPIPLRRASQIRLRQQDSLNGPRSNGKIRCIPAAFDSCSISLTRRPLNRTHRFGPDLICGTHVTAHVSRGEVPRVLRARSRCPWGGHRGGGRDVSRRHQLHPGHPVGLGRATRSGPRHGTEARRRVRLRDEHGRDLRRGHRCADGHRPSARQGVEGRVPLADRTERETLEFVERFKARNGTVSCKELLGCDLGMPRRGALPRGVIGASRHGARSSSAMPPRSLKRCEGAPHTRKSGRSIVAC